METFQIWGDILRAKTDWEEKRETPIRYKSFTAQDNRVVFEIESLPDDDITGQPRHIKTAKGYSVLRGDVEEINDDQLILYIRYGKPERLPKSGELRFDSHAAEVALNRQKAALDAVRFDRSVRADLRNLLVNPQQACSPNLDQTIPFIQFLNSSQQEVVKAALSTQDFLIVQGPPGTGKTTFITEVILQTIQQNPDARILLSSQTHVALDNALERIKAENSDLKLVRIGNHERVSEKVHLLLLDEQMNQWRNEVIVKGQQFIANWSAQRGISAGDSEMSSLFQKLKNTAIKLNNLREEIQIWQQDLDEICPNAYNPDNQNSLAIETIPRDRVDEVQSIVEEIDRLRQQSQLKRDERKKTAKRLHEVSGIECDELLKMSVEELEGYASILINDTNSSDAKMLQKMLSIQTEWFAQFGRNETFTAPLIKRSQVVAGTCIGIPRDIQDIEFDLCIVDEASKATATEALVPLARSQRWILVGDPKQLPPFQDEASRDTEFLNNYELTQEDIKETLFDYLLRTLPEANRKMLTIQHRMVKPIGELVSQCFYEGKIESARTDIDDNLNTVIPKPVTWLTTANLPNCREQYANPSYNNVCEINVIIKLIKQLNQTAIQAKINYSIAVLTGYSAQLKLFNRSLDSASDKLSALTIECNTVDAFQGREVDIAVYSVTRSNKKGDMGFLREYERLNVALSRGKVGLVIVGDHHFCRTSPHNPLSRVVDYVERHPEYCSLKEEGGSVMNVPEYDLISPEQLDPEQIARRYDNRAGFDLVSYREVGLPVYKITVQALTQIRKPIPPIKEYVLKAIHAGLSSEQDIAGFLGLEPSILREVMIELRLSENIDLIAPEDAAMQVWKLTKKGERTLREAQIIVPEERSFTINFDGILRYVRWYGRLERNLLYPRDLRKQGMMEIPPFPAKPPELSDIKLPDVDKIIGQAEKEKKKTRSREQDLLALKAIERRQRFFQPALALIYKAQNSNEVQVAFAIDGRLSSEHEQAFARANGVKKLRILETLKDSEFNKLAEDILGREFVAQAPLSEVEDIKEKVASIRATIETTRQTIERTQTDHEKKELEQKLQAANQEIEQLQAQLNTVPIRWLEVYEHRPLLEQALRDSQERLLIISPWIRANATNEELIQQLEKLLKRGVKVFIGYGLGEDDNQKTRDKKAENAIKKLEQQYDNFCLKRLGNTHAKILIYDSKFAVVTSFNWLSFKGDPKRTFRDERGTLVSDSHKIQELFDKEMKRF